MAYLSNLTIGTHENVLIRDARAAERLNALENTYPVACVIRQDNNGDWAFINDSGHAPIAYQSVTTDENGYIVLTRTRNASKVGSLVVTPDETFAPYVIAGASVGTQVDILRLYVKQEMRSLFRITNGTITRVNGNLRTPVLYAASEIAFDFSDLNMYKELDYSAHLNFAGSSAQPGFYTTRTGAGSVHFILFDKNGAGIDLTNSDIYIDVTLSYDSFWDARKPLYQNASGNLWVLGRMNA